MRDFSDDLKELRRRLGEAEGYLKIGVGRARLTELEFEISRPDLWDDQELAKRINAPIAICDKQRRRPGEIESMTVIGDVSGKRCILVDDIVDSGGTLCSAADVLLDAGGFRLWAHQ